MAASVATGSPLPESGVLQGAADANVDALIEQSRRLATTPLGDRDRLASLLLAVPFLVVSVALVVFAHSSRQAGLWTLGVFVVSYALASRIDFEIGTGGRGRPCPRSSCSCRCSCCFPCSMCRFASW